MPSAYLSQDDLNIYDVPTATNAQILSASALVDAYLKRPEGLQWMPDYAGNPCYMSALTPTFSFTLPAPISPGINVSIPTSIAGYVSAYGQVGNVVLIDRLSGVQGKPTNCEACVIGSITSTAIVLNSVGASHAQGATVEFGMVIREQKSLPSKRSLTRLSRWPIARLISGLGSYRYGRRDEQNAGLYADQSVLALMQTFGGPPEWLAWNTTTADYSEVTNEVWIPSGIFLAYYSDVRIFYVAGYQAASIPPCIKQATAGIIQGKINATGLQGGMKEAKAGQSALQRFESTVLDDDLRAQLAPYRALMLV
jgi:hypothetical protein